MLTKLLSVDGKIPVLQILIGILIGAIGMFVYAKFYRPKILYETETVEELKTENGKQIKNTVKQQIQQQPTQRQQQQQQQQQRNEQIISEVEPAEISAPSFIDIRQVGAIPLAMPKLSTMYREQDEYPETEDALTEDEEEEETQAQRG